MKNESKPNVIILCADEMRGDCAGFMGNSDIKTPNIDRFAENAIIFENHMTTFPKCVPARVSLLTGQYCHTYGLRTVQQTLQKGHINLLDRFVENDYETVFFGKNHCWCTYDVNNTFTYTSHRTPFSRFFKDEENIIPKENFSASRQVPRLEQGWDYIGNNTRHKKDEVYTNQAIEYIKSIRDTSKPFFLQLNIESPHTEYGVEEPYFSMYDRQKIKPWTYTMPKNASLPLFAQRKIRTGLDAEEKYAREIQCVYYGMISKVDYLLGKVLKAIESEGLMENSIILFWSDHGDYAGQYSLVEKWDTDFRDCLLHVPFVLYAPNLPKGRRVEALTDTSDIASTLCELANLEELPEMHGKSMLPCIEGQEIRVATFADGGHEKEMRERYVAKGKPTPSNESKKSRLPKSETYYFYPDSMARAKMIRTKDYKMIIRQVGESELYDLKNDPWELENIWSKEGNDSLKIDLMQHMLKWCLDTDTEKPFLDNFSV